MSTSREMRVNQDEFSILVQDLHSARQEIEALRRGVANAKAKQVEQFRNFAMLFGFLTPMYNHWPWYYGVAFFFGVLLAAIKWDYMITGIREKDTEWPEEKVYERKEWYDWAPRDKPSGW